MINKKYVPLIIIAATAFIIYANTIGHEYALDDKAMITHNMFTQKGVSGIPDILSYDSMAGMFGKESKELEGGRYRPLSIVTFAIEQEFFSGNPHISHFINIILYIISLIILYRVLEKLFNNFKHITVFLSIPFIATMLFAVHPLHTEIVANIKGRDEIIAFLFAIAAMNSIINYFDDNKQFELINAFIFIFLGSMSKEIAITFVAIIPISIYFFRDIKLNKHIRAIIPLLAGAGLYLFIRSMVIGDQTGIEANQLMNNPFLGAEIADKYATIFYTLGLYLKLIVFPHPLTWDYYPYHIGILTWSDWRAIISLILYLVLGLIALLGMQKKTVYSYGILVFLFSLSITSNLFFNIGAFMSERFVYVSLLGFCIIAAFVLCEKLPVLFKKNTKYRQFVAIILGLVLVLFSVKTISRNQVWKNSLSLFANDVHISKNSAKGNSSYGSELYSLAEEAGKRNDTITRNSFFRQAIPYFEKAIEIYPGYTESLIRLGNIYYTMYGDYKTMFDYYLKTLDVSPLNADVWNNTIGVLSNNVYDPEYEKALWKEIILRSPLKWDSYFYLGELYFYESPQLFDSAIHYYEIAKKINPDKFELLKNLGISYGNINDFESARINLLKSAQIREDAEVYRFIGLTYGIQGDDEKALFYFEKALEIEPENLSVIENIRLAKLRLGLI